MCIKVLFERKFGELCDVFDIIANSKVHVQIFIKSNGMRLSSEIVAIFN